MPRMRFIDALAGALAFVLTASLAELLAAAISIVSPRLAVGDAVIRLSPASAVHFAISTLGTYDKPVLLATIVAITIAFGAVVGVIARSRPEAAAYGFGLWWAVCAVAVWADHTQPAAAAMITAFPALAGFAALRLLQQRADVNAYLEADADTAVLGDPRRRVPDRRAFLGLATASAGASVAALFGARGLRGGDVDVEAARQAITLPVPRDRLPAVPPTAALDVPGISALVTPNDEFYRIDTSLSVPRVDIDKWRLKITGMVDRPLSLSYTDLAAMSAIEADVTLACVSNEVGEELVGNARWLGIPLRAILEQAGVQAGATQIVGKSVEGFTVGFPTAVALDGRASMVVLGMNGEVLPADHGFPARLLIPGLYGYVSATKWLGEISLTTWEAFDAYWIPRGWAKEGPIKTQSRIDVPSEGKSVAAGRRAVAGVAWGGDRSISKVEVRIIRANEADGPWQTARLGEALAQTTWRQWVVEWDATPGDYQIAVRATDGKGETQTAQVAPVDPSGATGYHKIRVKVA